MKSLLMQMQKTALLLGILCLSFYDTQATTFTAINSGTFSSTAVWAGGVVPPTLVNGDIIIVPGGINISMDQDLALQSSSSLTVNGSLTGTSGKFMSINNASLSGNGSINVDSFSANFTSGFGFTGSLSAGIFHSTNAMINAAATVLVKNSLQLAGGTTTIAQGTLSFLPNALIEVNGGNISVITGGILNLSTTYHVTYKNFAASSGVELTGSGLTDLTIDIPATSKMMLSNDLTVKGMLKITSGILDLNAHDLTLGPLSDFFASGAGMSGAYGGMDVSSSSSLYINAKNGLTGGLELVRKSTPSNPYAIPQLKNLTINTDPGKFVRMASPWDLQIIGVLDLQSGLIDYAHMVLGDTAKISGGGPQSYVVTSQTVVYSNFYASTNVYHFRMPIKPGNTRTFPIGSVSHYAPCTVTNNSNNPNYYWSAGVYDIVRDHGMNGVVWSAMLPVVAATWNIFPPDGLGPITADVKVMWDASMEVNSFNRNNAYVTEYDDHGVTLSGSWDLRPTTPALPAPNSMYSMTRSFTNTPMAGAYSVFEQKTMSVSNIGQVKDLKIYPNPANDKMNLAFTHEQFGTADITISNVLGKIVRTTSLQSGSGTRNCQIDIAALSAGMYMITIVTPDGHVTQKFVKE